MPKKAPSQVSFALELEAGGDGAAVAQAKQVARLRRLLTQKEPGVTGPHFRQNVWEFYSVKATWSDALCEALNHSSMYFTCFAPCGWPYRLFHTMKRAAPINVRCFRCVCGLPALCTLPALSLVFALPVLACLTFLPAARAALEVHFKTLPILGVQPDMAQTVHMFSIVLVVWAVFMSLFWWSRLLMAVGSKYNVTETIDTPGKFMAKAMCCICAYNQRVGLHVDRAQGFREAHKADRTQVELSDSLAPAQEAMLALV